MDFEELLDLKRVKIKTIVTNDQKKIDDILWSFLQPAHGKKKLIGLDTEWVLFQNQETKDYETKCATLQLCDGRSCLIIQLQHLSSIPNSLLNFLRLADYTFVGIGIKDNLAKLEKHYGIGCRNVVELGRLVAGVKCWSVSFCGVDDLSRLVSEYDLGEDIGL